MVKSLSGPPMIRSHLKFRQFHWVTLQGHEHLSSAVHPNTHLLVSMHFLRERGTCKLEDPPRPRTKMHFIFSVHHLHKWVLQRWAGLIVTDFFLSIFSFTKRTRLPDEHAHCKVSSNVERDSHGQGNPDALCNVLG